MISFTDFQKLTLRTKEIVTCESIAEGFHLNGNKS